MVPDKDRPPLEVDVVTAMLKEIPTPLCAESLHKFHATRKLKEEPVEDAMATFLVEIEMRHQKAHTLHAHLVKLQDNAVSRLVGGQLRGPTMQQKGLAAALQKQLYTNQ